MKRKSILVSIVGLFVLSGCKFSIGNLEFSFFEGKNKEQNLKSDEINKNINESNENTDENNNVNNDDISGEVSANDFEFANYKNGIKLNKYIGPYRPLINIPSLVDGKKVISIGSGCFKRAKTQKRSNTETNDDCNAYTIPDEIEEIEEDTFESDSTFFVEGDEIHDGWEDEALSGSVENENGNIYFNVNPDEVSLDDNYVVYSYLKNEDAYCLARCLTKKSEISIGTSINGKPITQVGYQSFFANEYIETVYFPETIGYLQRFAFQSCVNLKNVTFNSPNLSSVRAGAFSNCVSLDIVHMPENMVQLSSQVFQNCGVLSEVHLPGNLVKVLDDAFENTTVLKIVFGGFLERWNELIENCPNLQSIPVECLGTSSIVELDDLRDFGNLAIGSNVIFKGILSGYARQSWHISSNNSVRRAQLALITDPVTRYTIVCYNVNTSLYDLSLVGREVIAHGIRSVYFGNLELIDAAFETTEDETIHNIEPLEFDWDSPDFDPAECINYFTHYEGAITEIGSTTYVEGLNFYFYYFASKYGENTYKVGDVISFNFIIVPFNQVVEGLMDMDSITIISSNSEQSENGEENLR